MNVLTRFFMDPRQSYFMFGPRGTGKSTWVERLYPGSLRVDLLDPVAFRSYSARPERLFDTVAGHPERKVVVIDEIQKVPALLSVVHGLMERDKTRKFVLTGSSARKLRRAGVDLLAGRALRKTLHPFMAGELGDAFHLEDALNLGLVPVVRAAPDPGAALAAYADLYVREEVQVEGMVRNIGDFARFLEVASFSQGAVLNVSNVARECEVGRKAVEGYVRILEDLLLSFRVPVFTRRAVRATTKHPKFYLFDAGVYRSLRPAGPLDSPDEIGGAALEGLVAQHLRAWIAYTGGGFDLFYWRTYSGTEVDFIVYGRGGFWAVEVKNSAVVRPKDLRPLKSFLREYSECKALFLYRGEERMLRDNILCIPCASFLRSLRPGKELHELTPGPER